LTLTGPAGVGKSRLALQVAHTLVSTFPDGIGFVDLSPVSDARLVLSAVGRALRLPVFGDRPPAEQLAAALAHRTLLLVLDNFEHVTSAAPELASLLEVGAGLTVLATSRQVLGISGEHVFPVSPLADEPAIELFAQRARAIDPRFELSSTNRAAVTGICRRVDGLPLAIELAATRIDVLSPEAMLERLESPLVLLTGGPSDAPQRQRTMRDAIAWSYDLLSDAERAAFRRLAVFAGPFDLDAAEHLLSDLCAHRTESEPGLGLLGSLRRRSLVQPFEREGGRLQFRLLETLREFGRGELETCQELESARRHHADYFCRYVWLDHPDGGGPDERTWLERIQEVEDDLWAVLDWSLAGGDLEPGLRIADGLYLYWYVRKRRLREARAWLEQALPRARATPGAEMLLANVLLCATGLAHLVRDVESARSYAKEALGIWQRAGGPAKIAIGQYLLAIPVFMAGDNELAEQLFRAAIEGLRLHARRPWVANALMGIAQVAAVRGDYAAAAASYAEAIAVAKTPPVQTSVQAMALMGAGSIAACTGALVEAAGFYRDALLAWSELDDPGGSAEAMEGLAGVACAAGYPVRAVRLMGGAEALRERSGFPVSEAGLDWYRRTVTAIQSSLTMRQFAQGWGDGRQLSADDALALALADLPVATPQAHNRRRSTSVEGLSRREVEVLRLLATGQTDREIADSLFIGRRTASDHVSNILHRLGVRSRTEAAAYAAKRGLV
jgi:non-specific serine/threonine protein kinase